MPYNTPSTQELANRNLSNIESVLNTHTPAAEKAFNTVLATTEGMAGRELYAYATNLIHENFALTAGEEGLEKIGREHGIQRAQPAAWEGVARFDISDGKTLHPGTVFMGPQELEYETTASVTAASLASEDGVLVPLACRLAGPSGNLSVNDTLVIQAPIAGAGRTMKVVEVKALGAPIENPEAYRQRILDFERSEGGGGNSSDYRAWAQAVKGVRRVYPFSGPPEGTERDALPGERTVYVECVSEINDEGIPPQPLLDLVRDALLADPDTGVSREILGLPRDTLYVRPIVQIPVYITVVGISISRGSIGDALAAVQAAAGALVKSFCPFVPGLDPEFEKNNEITASIIGREAQNALDEYGGSAQNVMFGISPDSFTGKYTLKRNEKPKLAKVAFVEAG